MAKPFKTYFPDPNDQTPYVFEWTSWLGNALLASAVVTITGPDGALTKDNDQILPGNQQVFTRVLGGTVGTVYRLTCQVTTNEIPARRKEVSIFLQPRDN